MSIPASPTCDCDPNELDENDLACVAGGAGVVDDDGCELPPGDTPHDQIPSTPAPMPTPVDPSLSGLSRF